MNTNNSDMNPNNDDTVKVNTNCCYDDTNNILSFYLWWQQVQVRVLDDDHNDIIVDHDACDNDYDIHVIHDTDRNNNGLVFTDDNDVIVDRYAIDNDHDLYAIHDIVRNYRSWKQVQVRSLDDDHDSYDLDHNTIRCGNNNTPIKNNVDVMYDNNGITYNNQFEHSTSILDNNDVTTDIYEFDTDN